MRRYRSWFLFLAVLLAGGAHAGAEPTWLSSVDDALARSKEERKPVFMEIASARSPACARRDQDLYSQAGLRETLDSFVLVRLDAERDTTADRWNPTGYPTLIVLQPDGKEIARPLATLDSVFLARALEAVLDDERELIRLQAKIAAEPADVPSQVALARIRLRRGDASAAQPIVDKLSLSSDAEARKALPSLLLGLGMALGKGGPNPKGKEYFERLVRDFPQSHEAEQAHYLLGMVHFMQGNREEAARSLRKVIETTTDEYLRERAERMLRQIRPAK